MASSLLSTRIFFISTGVLSLALLLQLSVSLVTDFSVHEAWISLISWLKPPYLYVVINGIIISIAASSRFYGDQEEDLAELQVSAPFKISSNTVSEFGYTPNISTEEVNSSFDFESAPEFSYGVKVSFDLSGSDCDTVQAVEAAEIKSEVVLKSSVDDEEAYLISKSNKRRDSPEIISPAALEAEKPLVSARFSHRKQLKGSPEGGRAMLKVSKPKREETLENTWKAITEGRAMPLTRHLKKCDTWEHHHNQKKVDGYSPDMKKSKTFKDETNYQTLPDTPSPVKLRKEPSLSHDELNRRVEAFIRKFNEEMRLQREESLNHYNEMVFRG